MVTGRVNSLPHLYSGRNRSLTNISVCLQPCERTHTNKLDFVNCFIEIVPHTRLLLRSHTNTHTHTHGRKNENARTQLQIGMHIINNFNRVIRRTCRLAHMYVYAKLEIMDDM